MCQAPSNRLSSDSIALIAPRYRPLLVVTCDTWPVSNLGLKLEENAQWQSLPFALHPFWSSFFSSTSRSHQLPIPFLATILDFFTSWLQTLPDQVRSFLEFYTSPCLVFSDCVLWSFGDQREDIDSRGRYVQVEQDKQSSQAYCAVLGVSSCRLEPYTDFVDKRKPCSASVGDCDSNQPGRVSIK